MSMPSAPEVPPGLRAEITALIAGIKNRPDLTEHPDRDWSLPELGFDSLDVVELAERLDRDYGFELGADPEDFAALARIGTLVDLVARRRRAA
ncbi:acyl carrier protein [Streptacidiphilus sp. 4-A2]|nr:acyl carrier protein [Streptacidiphilus sp. 4-A2]